MSTPNPRRSLARPRPSLGNSGINTASSPSLGATYKSPQRPPLPNPPSSALNSANTRKASFNQLTSGTLSTVPDGSVGYGLASTKEEEGSSPFTMHPGTPASQRRESGGEEIEVGDAVDVPGGMHGTVKFLGSVRNRVGVFVGVELSRLWAARGKNDGDVDGTRYFTTSIPGAGIFLPLARAKKRASPTVSADSFPPTPTSPSLKGFNLGGGDSNAYKTSTPLAHKFSQSVGPGRAPSPALRPKSRPSLPRPESPLRKTQILNSTPAGRRSLGASQHSKGGIGGPRYAPSPNPGKFGASVRGQRNSTIGDPGKKYSQPPKPGMRTPVRPSSRSQSRLGPEPMFDQDQDTTQIGVATTKDDRSDEVEILKAKLEERDRQLKEQTLSLTEMEHNVAELQSLLPSNNSRGPARGGRGSGLEDADAAQLRTLLREKNEKIAIITAEFDAHRADFRSTIDTLELASTETERVYERRVEDLLQEVRDLQGRDDDFESVAQQLKQLEELVQELEEGLEDARRGEAEARGEVEFLRGEVERGRSELRREREKAAAALKGAGAAVDGTMSPGGTSRDLEQRDDEIRGLKAIIHSLSRDSVPDVTALKASSRRTSRQKTDSSEQTNGQGADELAQERQAREKLEREVKELEGLVDRKTYREEELERELERLRGEQTGSNHTRSGSNGHSEPTPIRSSRDSARNSRERHDQQLETMHEGDTQASVDGASNLWCEICDSHGHDILTCTNMFGDPARQSSSQESQQEPSPKLPRTGRDVVREGLRGLSVPSPHADDRVAPLSPGNTRSAPNTPKTQQVPMPNPMDLGLVAGKASGVIDETKWCALCERDGHESVDCPFEEDF